MDTVFSWEKDHAVACASLVLLFVTTSDDKQLCHFHSANRSQRLVVHHILEIFCVLFYGALACLHSYQEGVCFEGDSSSSFTIRETFKLLHSGDMQLQGECVPRFSERVALLLWIEGSANCK